MGALKSFGSSTMVSNRYKDACTNACSYLINMCFFVGTTYKVLSHGDHDHQDVNESGRGLPLMAKSIVESKLGIRVVKPKHMLDAMRSSIPAELMPTLKVCVYMCL